MDTMGQLLFPADLNGHWKTSYLSSYFTVSLSIFKAFSIKEYSECPDLKLKSMISRTLLREVGVCGNRVQVSEIAPKVLSLLNNN